MTVACHSCGSLRGETPWPDQRIKGLPHLCLDCLLEYASEVTRPQRLAETRERIRREGIITRASDRAALRWRQRQPQIDLVDLLRGAS